MAFIGDRVVNAKKLSAGMQDLVPNLNVIGANVGDGTGYMAVYVRDADDNFILGDHYLVRVWIAEAEHSEPDPQTDFSVLIGEEMREIEANADYEVISDDMLVQMQIDVATDRTVYLMAELDGRVYTDSVAITGN